jgi:Holliday junction resolvase-like predicted endonuclease
VSNHRAEIGAAAEREAAAVLTSAGWRILARNLRVAGLEVDILARDETDRLVAVEVRARRFVGAVTPAEILGKRKRAALRRQREAISGLARVDLLLVVGPPGERRFRLVRGVAERGTRWVEGGRITRRPVGSP